MSDDKKKMHPAAKFLLGFASMVWLLSIPFGMGKGNSGETSKPQTKEASEDNQKDVLMKAAKLNTTMNYYNYGGSILETPIGSLKEE